MREDVEGAIQRTKIGGRCVCSAELQRADFEGRNSPLRVRNFRGNEEVIALIFSGLCRVTDLGLKNVPPSLLGIGLTNVDLCASVDGFMLQREKQFVTSANKRRHEIRDQDGIAFRKNALCLRARWICLNDLPLAYAG